MPLHTRKVDRAKLEGALPILRCRCGKVFAPTKQDARNIRRQIVNNGGHQPNEVRYYECQDGAWHWTERLNTYRICPICGKDFNPREMKDAGHRICDPCWDRDHPKLPEPKPIPATSNPTPHIFSRRNAP